MIGKKILITGSTGLLGSALVEELNHLNVLTPTREQLDMTKKETIDSYIRNNAPDIIIHTAAHTNLEESETNPSIAWLVNTIGTLNVCNAILGTKCKLIYISSTGIYGKESKKPWLDFDTPTPTTLHHKSKLEAERIIRNHVKNHLILRTGWLFGGPLNNPKNFVYNRYKEMKGKDIINANAKQWGNPTCVTSLSKQIKLLIEKEIVGTFNAVNSNSSSRLDYIKTIAFYFGLSTQVVPYEGKYNRLANVSDNEMAENFALNLMGLNLMGDYEPLLGVYIGKIIDELRNEH